MECKLVAFACKARRLRGGKEKIGPGLIGSRGRGGEEKAERDRPTFSSSVPLFLFEKDLEKGQEGLFFIYLSIHQKSHRDHRKDKNYGG